MIYHQKSDFTPYSVWTGIIMRLGKKELQSLIPIALIPLLLPSPFGEREPSSKFWHAISESRDLPTLVARTSVDKEVKVIRDNREGVISVAVSGLKEEGEVVVSSAGRGLGLTVQELTPQVAEALGLNRTEGVVVTSVKAGSPAEEAGFHRGDVILEIDRKPIRAISDYQNTIINLQGGKAVLFLVHRQGTTLFLALRTPAEEE